MRSTASSSTPYSRVETIDWHQSSSQQSHSQSQSQQRADSPGASDGAKSPRELNGPSHAPVDVGLVLKLQQKLKDVEKENGRLIRMVEDLERDSPEDVSRTQDSFRVSLVWEFVEFDNGNVGIDVERRLRNVGL